MTKSYLSNWSNAKEDRSLRNNHRSTKVRILGSYGYVLRRCVRSGAEFVSQRTEFSVASNARHSLLRRGRPSDATLL
jgi:hypothetical protein